MKTVRLTRFCENMWGTFGALIGDDFICTTVERQWADNKPNESRYPDGEYICRRIQSPKFGNTFEITGCDGRTSLLFHRGNYQTDSKGCTIVAAGFGELNKQLAVTDSGTGFGTFMKHMEGIDEFKLIVKTV